MFEIFSKSKIDLKAVMSSMISPFPDFKSTNESQLETNSKYYGIVNVSYIRLETARNGLIIKPWPCVTLTGDSYENVFTVNITV